MATHKPKIHRGFVVVVSHENELSLHEDNVNHKNEEMWNFGLVKCRGGCSFKSYIE
jgi:hypothetical protein